MTPRAVVLRASPSTWHQSNMIASSLRAWALTLALGSGIVGVVAACGEDTTTPVGNDGGTSTVTGSIGFLEPCTANAECMTGLCYRYNMATVGMRCSKTCTMATAAADCPAPSSGCNNMGVCKND